MACAKKIAIEITPNWQQDLNLYLLTLAPSGTNKSGVVKVLRKPITDYENEFNESNKAVLEQKRSEWRIANQSLKEIEKELAKPTIDEDLKKQHEARRKSLLERLKEQEPTELRLLCDDATVEVMAKLMSENGGKIAMIEAEGHGFVQKLQGQYSGKPNLDLVLKSDEDPSFILDRINNERKGFKIENPRMTIGLACQPSVFTNLKADLYDTGLFARFLISNSAHKFKPRILNNDKPDEKLQGEYGKAIKQLLNRESNLTLTFKPDAYNLFNNDIYKKIQDELFHGDLTNDHGKSFGGKLAGKIARIIAIVHMMEQAGYEEPSTQISLEAVKRCILLVDYFISHKLDFHAKTTETAEEREHDDIMKKIIEFGEICKSGKNEFEGSAFYRARMRRRFPKAEEFKKVLEAMHKKEFLEMIPRANNKYLIRYNPDIFDT